MSGKLGLIGGTGPESTIIYYRELTSRYAKERPGEFPPIIIESLSVFRVLGYTDKHDYKGLKNYILKGIRNLAAGGATYAALTGITPHIVFDRLQKESPIPLVSMVDTTVEALKKQDLRTVLLLGTYPTMHENFVSDVISNAGIKVVKPEDSDQHTINHKIEDELEYGVVKPETVNYLKNLCEYAQKSSGVDAVILGCTELPLAFKKIDLSIPKIDVMEIHIQSLLQRLLN